MSKKYGRSGMEKSSEEYYEELREKHPAQEAMDIVQDRSAMKRLHKNIFGHNGWF